MSATPIDNLTTWVDAYREACTNRDQWAEIADRAKQQITQHLDTEQAEVGTVDGRPAVKWTEVVTRRINTKALKEKDPELADRYTVTSTSHRFTIITDDESSG
jgi:predicted phage-related endonuclease